MKLLKHILLVIALMTAMAPCVHADHHVHCSDEQTQEFRNTSCECHSCDHQQTSEHTDIDLSTTPQKTAQLRLLIAFIRFEIAPQKPITQPRHLSAHLAHRAKQSSLERLASVQFLI